MARSPENRPVSRFFSVTTYRSPLSPAREQSTYNRLLVEPPLARTRSHGKILSSVKYRYERPSISQLAAT